MRTSMPSVMNARYQITKETLITGYYKVIDHIQEKELMGRFLPKAPQIKRSLGQWSRVSHHCFAQVFRYLDLDQQYLAVMRPLKSGARPLSEIKASQLRVSELGSIFVHLVRACRFLADRKLIHPHLDLTKVFYHEGHIKIVGHEAAISADDPQAFERIAEMDVRYCAPEILVHRRTSERSDIYHLGSLFYHFLSGATFKSSDEYESICQGFRRLKRSWDELLSKMLQVDPTMRPSWDEVDHMAQEINEGKGPPLLPVWMGDVDNQTVKALKDNMFKARKEPRAVALQVYPGREKIYRLEPFTKWAEKENYLVFHSWLSEKQTRHYKAINDVLALLKEWILRNVNQDAFLHEIEPLSEWEDVDKLIRKWRDLLKQLFKILIPSYADGIVLIIEDVQHMDHASLETILKLSEWLGDFPFLLVVTGHCFAHENMTELWDKWPYEWEYIRTRPFTPRELASLIWDTRPLEEREIDARRTLEKTNALEVMVFYWLEDEHKNKGAFDGFLNEIWSCLSRRERMILKIISCSERPLRSIDIEKGFKFDGASEILERLTRFEFLDRDDDWAYSFGIQALSNYCRNRISGKDLNHIYERLRDHERKQDQPDSIQLAFLTTVLEGSLASEETRQNLNQMTLQRLETKPLWRLAQIHKTHGHVDFQLFRVFAQIRRGIPPSHRQVKHSEVVTLFARGLRRLREGEPKTAMETFRRLSRRRSVQAGIKAFALMMTGECAMRTNNPRALATAWLHFNQLERDRLHDLSWHECRIRLIAAAGKIGAQLKPAPSDEGEPNYLSSWLQAEESLRNGTYGGAITLFQTALQRMADHYDVNWAGRVYKGYGNALYRGGMPEEAITAYRKAERCFLLTKDEIELNSVAYNLASSELLAGRLLAAYEHFVPLYDKASKEKDAKACCQILSNLLASSLFLNQTEHFRTFWDKHEELTRAIRARAERAEALTIRLHGAFLLSKSEVCEYQQELLDLKATLLKEGLLEENLKNEIDLANRLALFAQGLPCESDSQTYPRFTHWRHLLIDALTGRGEQDIRELVDQIGDGYFSSAHFYLLSCAINAYLVPKKHFTQHLANAFERHATKTGASYGPFIRKHFAHLRTLGEAPSEIWERALLTFESVYWHEPDISSLKYEALNNLNSIWPFDNWGACLLDGSSWKAIQGETNSGIYEHLDTLNLHDLAIPIVTTRLHPKTYQTQSLLILPLNVSDVHKVLIWFINRRAADHDLSLIYEPLYRFYGKMFEYIIYRDKISNIKSVPGQVSEASVDFGIVGRSQGVAKLTQKIVRFGPTSINIFISGESGTGKELAANALHVASNRRHKPFRPINCSHFPENLVESELFGHVKGAFTGANYDKEGLLSLVDGGTLFLDEIGDINHKVQSLLLRVMQEGEYSRVGDSEIRKVDIRFITATNKDLNSMIDRNEFRADLYFRMVGEELKVPALRHRLDDLSLLIPHFASKYEPSRTVTFSRDFIDNMRDYTWPGNIRELESYVRKLLVHHPDVSNFQQDHCIEFMMKKEPAKEDMTLAELENVNRRELIGKRLAQFGGNRTHTAQSLAISRQQLNNLMRKLGLT